jgi:hypothetical protein
MTASTLQPIDHTGLKTGTALTLMLLIVAFVLDSWLLVALVALCQLCGALQLPFAPYRLALSAHRQTDGHRATTRHQ